MVGQKVRATRSATELLIIAISIFTSACGSTDGCHRTGCSATRCLDPGHSFLDGCGCSAAHLTDRASCRGARSLASSLPDERATDCILDVVRSMKFPVPRIYPDVVNLPLMFD